MDLATVIGLALGIGAVLVSALLEGTNPMSLFNLPACVLILGGTLGTSATGAPLAAVLQLPRFLRTAVMSGQHDFVGRIQEIIDLAQKSRREGLLALEQVAQTITDPFLRRGLPLVVDGGEAETVRAVLETEIAQWEQKERTGEALFTAMGGYAPTVGIIGTVLGLIHALGQMDDPKKMGHAIAGAFLATLYGVAIANLVLLPIGTKLKLRTEESKLLYEISLEGLMAIQAGENPRVIEQKLGAYLNEAQRAALTAAMAETK